MSFEFTTFENKLYKISSLCRIPYFNLEPTTNFSDRCFLPGVFRLPFCKLSISTVWLVCQLIISHLMNQRYSRDRHLQKKNHLSFQQVLHDFIPHLSTWFSTGLCTKYVENRCLLDSGAKKKFLMFCRR